MQFPDDDNGDVLRRMEKHEFDFSREHEIEFFAVFATEEEAKQIGELYLADHQSGEKTTNIETTPNEEGGMALILAKIMFPTHENITSFEEKLAERVSTVEGYLDGWGVLQDE
jgi:hypothetical protein